MLRCPQPQEGKSPPVQQEDNHHSTIIIDFQLCYAGFHIVSRAALNMGISKVVFPVYRNTIALMLMAPFAYFLEKKDRPLFTFPLLIQVFLLALCGITANQGCYLLGLYYLSPTYASAIQNSTPAITFVLAVAMRLEQANIKKWYGIAKVLGTVVSIGGATIITLYGVPIRFQPNLTREATPLSSQILNWALGCVYILGNCLAWSAWMVLQVPVLKKYPARLSLTTLTCFFGLLQFLAIAAFTEKDIERWKGVVASGIAFSLQLWCIDRGGPLFVAVFQPVQTLMVAIMASIILGDQLYSGGLIGSIVITAGLYSVLWGKSKEKREEGLERQDTTSTLRGYENSQEENLLAVDY
ncbi:hypothetical protein HPP92_008119 [Vanilla planifolia]|uniref:WAT1-related protein n=1 Tax=Vanilla planifolia TaxID=51239 RepID=A0A835V3H2_VANPL|nr:hypothetical protein HPP92_008119 [Vanilla planifolia]